MFLDEPADLMAEVYAAVSAAADEPLRSEPVLAAEVAASTRANVLHWAAGIARDPGGRVPANLTPEVLGIAREAFRRGIEQTVYTTYHAGQNVVWAYWMRTAFSLSSDPAVLRQVLEAGSRSVSAFVDDMVAALSEQIRRERAELARSSHVRRFEVVSLILESAPITTERASTQLGYDLRRRHAAAIIWTDPRYPDQAALAQAAEAVGRATRALQVLTVIASSSSVWRDSRLNSPSTSSGTAMTNLTGAIRRTWTIADASGREPATPQGDAAPVPTAARATKDRRNHAARGWAFGLLVALLVQFGLGMYVNLFANIPLNHPGHGANDFFAGSYHSVAWAETSPHAPLILAFHAGLGLLLVVGSLWLAVLAIRGRRAGMVWAAVLGALCVLGAGFNGASFLNYNKNANSYVMALLFAAAVLCYSVILALPGNSERQASEA